MSLKLAKTAGFCMGVRRAIDIALDAINEKDNIYTYGPLVHNPQAIEMLESKGIKALDKVNGTLSGTVVIRAHGIPPNERLQIQEKGLKILDATCPRVIKVQSIIKKQANEGYNIVIVGDREHPEVIGLLGFSLDKGIVLSGIEEVDNLPQDIEKICVVAQTTQDTSKFTAISEKIKERFSNVIVFNTICDSTSKRQKEAIDLAKKVDIMVVIGGRNSGNTQRLTEVSESTGTKTLHVETEEDIDPRKIINYNNIGVTAGASTPNWMINRVVDRIESLQKKRGSNFSKFWSDFLGFLVMSNIYVAFGAGCLSYVSCLLQGITPRFSYFLIAGSYVFSMHILYYFMDKDAARYNDPVRADFYKRYNGTFVTFIILSASTSLYLSFQMGAKVFFFLITISVLGLIYGIRIIPKSLWNILHYKKLKDIPGSKTVFVALAWGAVTSILPALALNQRISLSTVIAFFFVVILVFVRSALFDIMDIQGDKIVGKETLPITIGENKTRFILRLSLIILSLILLSSSLSGFIPSLGYLLLVCVIYAYSYLFIYEKMTISHGILLEGMVESNFVLGWLVSLIWIYSLS
ncbi:MAG: 4-hydroxy-3-methylbut-2-enyl diphosphate reductase [Pseudomonadota bacterium]